MIDTDQLRADNGKRTGFLLHKALVVEGVGEKSLESRTRLDLELPSVVGLTELIHERFETLGKEITLLMEKNGYKVHDSVCAYLFLPGNGEAPKDRFHIIPPNLGKK